jgi:glycosyltransferase involved in cell wall biosynthesis
MPVLAVELYGKSAEYSWKRADAGDGLDFVTLLPDVDSSHATAEHIRRRMDEVFTQYSVTSVAIPGWGYKGALVALEWCVSNGIPAIMMSESTAWDDDRNRWKEWIKSWIVGLASTALVGGRPHADYIQQLGMSRERIFLGYDVVDNAYFASEAEKWREQESADGERVQAGGDSRPYFFSRNSQPYFLSSNRFVEKKNLFRLLDAYERYLKSCQLSGGGGKYESADAAPPWDLCMLGDGELKADLLAHCGALGLHVVEGSPWDVQSSTDNRRPTTVFFPGFRQIDELPRFYAHAGAFVHASTTEQWGLVVNEAMACGLPVIVSNRVGCARDLVEEGVNGFMFDPYNVEQLADMLSRISTFDYPLSALAAASAQHIAAWGPERFAAGMQAAVERAKQVGPVRANAIQRGILGLLTFR